MKKANEVRARRLHKIIQGALAATASAHPEYNITKAVAGSITKRAVGSIMANWDRLSKDDSRQTKKVENGIQSAEVSASVYPRGGN